MLSTNQGPWLLAASSQPQVLDPWPLLWRTGWDVHPSLLAVVGALVLVYVGGIAVQGRRTRERLTVGQGMGFALGIVALLLTLQSPLHHLSDDYLFSAHMAQHQLLILAVPPLLLMGIPGWLVRGLLAHPRIVAFGRNRAYPILALALFNVFFAFAHFPAIYDALFSAELAHRVTHIIILVLAAFTWLPLLSPVPDLLPRLSQPAQLLYCFVQTLPGALVGSLLTLADRVLYRHYGARPLELGLSPVTDQQLGGLIMWVVAGTFWLVALTVVFFRWADREEAHAFE